MYKKVEWKLSKSGEKELKEAGADKMLIEDRLIKAVSSNNTYYKEIVPGLYNHEPCPHVLVIERQKTGIYVTYVGFIGYVHIKEETIGIIDIQDLFKGLTWTEADNVINGTSDVVFDIKKVIKEKHAEELACYVI